MANFTDIYSTNIQVGEGVLPPLSAATFEPALDPSRPFTTHIFGINQVEAITNQLGVHNEIGLYNGVGLWNQLGIANLFGFGVDVGGHCDAQPNLESSASRIDFNSGDGNLNGFWKYRGEEISREPDETSDISLKKDIQPLENCLDKVLQLQSISFNWIEELVPSRYVKERPEIGFIAQEVEKVIPEVIGQKLVNDEEVKSINYGKLTTVLVGAIQEQQKQIQELKETVSKLSTGCQKCSGSCYTG